MRDFRGSLAKTVVMSSDDGPTLRSKEADLRRLVVGCGYLGQPVAASWLADGDQVFVTTRCETRAAELANAGFRPIVCDVTQPESLSQLSAVSAYQTVLFAVGFDRQSDSSIEDVYVDGLRHVLAALPKTHCFIYISSTGVYGQSQGEWVDEQSPCEPTRAGGKACLAAERLLQSSSWTEQAVVLRLAGIYGPGRIPNRSRLIAGQPMIAPTDSYLNLIHVEDAVRAIRSCAQSARPPVTYVVSDNHPVRRRAYYTELARLSGIRPSSITFIDAADDARDQRRTGNKRVRSTAILDALQIAWQYPDYRHGLAAVVADEPVDARKTDP